MPTTSSQDRQTARAEPLLAGPVVVGFDGSPAAARALDLVARALAPGGQRVVVAVEPALRSHGLLSEPLLEPGIDAGALLLGSTAAYVAEHAHG